MANTKLINSLAEKWSKPDGLPYKGRAISDDDKCNPCAQSEAVMMATGMGKLDFKSFLASNREGLDKTAARVLEISVPHAILLRRFNDSSSCNPSIALEEPLKILGPNCDEILKFWFFLDSLSIEDWDLIGSSAIVQDINNSNNLDEAGSARLKEWKTNKENVKKLSEDLAVIPPDLHGKLWYGSSVDSYCWKTSWDYCVSNGFTDLARAIPSLVAYASLEIQCMHRYKGYNNLYFCRILGYNPFNKGKLKGIVTLLRNKAKGFIKHLKAANLKINNKLFNATRQIPVQKVNLRETSTLKLTLDDLSPADCVEKIKSSVDTIIKSWGDSDRYGGLNLVVPTVNNEGQEKNLNLLLEKLRNDYKVIVWPGSSKLWTITTKNPVNRKFNAPSGNNASRPTSLICPPRVTIQADHVFPYWFVEEDTDESQISP